MRLSCENFEAGASKVSALNEHFYVINGLSIASVNLRRSRNRLGPGACAAAASDALSAEARL